MIYCILLIIVSAISNAVMDKISFHHEGSVFKDWSSWWNPKESWRFKWKNGEKEQGERFPLSSTLLVTWTDAWHAFKSLMRYSKLLCIPIYTITTPLFGVWIDFGILAAIQMLTFHLFFTYFFTQENTKHEKVINNDVANPSNIL